MDKSANNGAAVSNGKVGKDASTVAVWEWNDLRRVDSLLSQPDDNDGTLTAAGVDDATWQAVGEALRDYHEHTIINGEFDAGNLV